MPLDGHEGVCPADPEVEADFPISLASSVFPDPGGPQMTKFMKSLEEVSFR